MIFVWIANAELNLSDGCHLYHQFRHHRADEELMPREIDVRKVRAAEVHVLTE